MIEIELILDIGYQGKDKFTVAYPGRNFELRANSKEEAEDWVRKLNILRNY